jgi:hypothetical protein
MLLYLIEGSKIAPVRFESDGSWVLKLGRARNTPRGGPFVDGLTAMLEDIGLPFSVEGMGRTKWQSREWVPKVTALLNALEKAVSTG